jgi:hypothetical protein
MSYKNLLAPVVMAAVSSVSCGSIAKHKVTEKLIIGPDNAPVYSIHVPLGSSFRTGKDFMEAVRKKQRDPHMARQLVNLLDRTCEKGEHGIAVDEVEVHFTAHRLGSRQSWEHKIAGSCPGKQEGLTR